MKQVAVILLSAALFSTAIAQSPDAASPPHGPPSITKLPPPFYPPIALAAGVWGRVDLNIAVQPDGAVVSADVMSGPPMLREAAIEGAKQTRFDCARCVLPSTQFRIVYSFELAEAYYCNPPDPSYPRVSQSAGVVTFTGQPAGTCDPSATRVRSAKCFYLWKCGWR